MTAIFFNCQVITLLIHMVYRFNRSVYHGRMDFRGVGQYIVIIKDSGIGFIEGNFDDEYDYFNESLFQQNHNAHWVMERLGEHFIDFEFVNNSGSGITITVETIQGRGPSIGIENGMSEIYTLDDRLFSLGNMNIHVLDSHNRTKDNIFLKNHYLGTYGPLKILRVKINANGHEIAYYY